jgi:hypothetical protein
MKVAISFTLELPIFYTKSECPEIYIYYSLLVYKSEHPNVILVFSNLWFQTSS